MRRIAAIQMTSGPEVAQNLTTAARLPRGCGCTGRRTRGATREFCNHGT